MLTSQQYLCDFKIGKESALQYYMSIYGRELRFFAYSLTKNKEVAEEIVSDSFFKLWKGREKVEKEINIKSFLYIVTRNACYDFLDLVKTPIENSEFDEINLTTSDDTLGRIIRIELIQIIIEELRSLPEQQALIFQMTYFDGYTPEEISSQLNTTVNNVYFARSKARANLIKSLKRKGLSPYVISLFLIDFW